MQKIKYKESQAKEMTVEGKCCGQRIKHAQNSGSHLSNYGSLEYLWLGDCMKNTARD